MIQEMFHYGSIQALERMVQFTEARQKVLTHNIANINTPHYIPQDLDVKRFQDVLGEAIENRRSQADQVNGELPLSQAHGMRFGPNTMSAQTVDANDNILFHDRNNRNLEKTMQDLVENTMAHNSAIQMLKSRFELLESAIRMQP